MSSVEGVLAATLVPGGLLALVGLKENIRVIRESGPRLTRQMRVLDSELRRVTAVGVQSMVEVSSGSRTEAVDHEEEQ